MNRKKGIAQIFTAIFLFMGSGFLFLLKNTYENDWSNKFKSEYESVVALLTIIGIGCIVIGICDLVIAIVLLNTPDNEKTDVKAPKTKMKKCPVCEKFIDSNVAFCKYCGTNTGEFEKNNCTESKIKKCPVCNEAIDGDSLFCQHCGSDLKNADEEYEINADELVESKDDDTVVCAFCFKPTSSKYLYCEHCKRRRN